jgi:hypothetical protein
MKKLWAVVVVLLLTATISVTIAATPDLTVSKVLIGGDIITGTKADIERFQEAEEFVKDWFLEEGYYLSYDVNAEFMPDVGSMLPEGEPDKWIGKRRMIAGLFIDNKIYFTDHTTFVENGRTKLGVGNKLDVLNMVHRGVIIHEITHYYLGKYGISTIGNDAVHEYIAAIVEISSYSKKYRKKVILNGAFLIALNGYNAPEYVMRGSNYFKDASAFQTLSYYVYKEMYGDILVDSIMSIPN